MESSSTKNLTFGLIPFPAKLEITSEKDCLVLQKSKFIFVHCSNSCSLKPSVFENLNSFLSSKSYIVKFVGEENSSKEEEEGKVIILFCRLPRFESSLGEEGYELLIQPNLVFLSANTDRSFFYGVETFKQIIFAQNLEQPKAESISIPSLRIFDKPVYSWRGLHLDVGRHFFQVQFIFKFLDLLAAHKMNVFHWHLTEDQGWRIEIKKYPKLTEIGAWRDQTKIGKEDIYDNTRYGGFYTQDEIRQVVAYAADRFITVVPEIELPGHSQAAIASYPELGCTKDKVIVKQEWGVSHIIYNLEESTFEFLQNVFDEVLELFPSPWIHIGGDEVAKEQWVKNSQVQGKKKELGLESEEELQSHFIKRITSYLTSKGRKVIGWDEILEGGLVPSASVMSWKGISGGKEAARQSHHAVMTPTSHCYFDYYQSNTSKEPLAIGGFLPLEKVYSFDPRSEMNQQEQSFILGGQGNIWTEYMTSEQHVEYMAFPRACAMSEVLWTEKNLQNYNDFKQRLEIHLKRLDEFKVNYRKLD